MRITTLAPHKGNTWKVAFDGNDTLYFLNASVVEKYALQNDLELTEAQWNEICETELRRKAYSRACYLLDYRGYSYREMFHKLAQNYPETVCFSVVNQLAANGLINDRRYAEQLAHRYIAVKRFGLRRAKQEMQRRELLEKQIDEALLPYLECVAENLETIIAGKYAKYFEDPSDRKMIEKGKAALVRQGYSFGEINAAVKAYFAEQETT